MSETSEVHPLLGRPEMRRRGWGVRLLARRALTRAGASILVLATLSGARLSAEDPSPETEMPPPQPWQIAGVRAAFGAARQPINEPSPAVQGEALKFCAEKKWGDALDAQAVSAYLDSKDPALRRAAVQVLGQMGSRSGRFAKEIAALIEAESQAQNNDSDEVRSAAEETLGRIGASDLVPLLESDCGAVREAAANALGTTAKGDAATATKVAGLLADKRPPVRASAANALGQMGEVAAGSAKDLAALLEDREADVRGDAVLAIGHLGKAAAPFAGNVAALLQDEDKAVRGNAAAALGSVGGKSPAFAKQLVGLLHDGDEWVRSCAANSLGLMGPAAEAVAEELGPLLQDKDKDVRVIAAWALGRMGQEGGRFGKEMATLLQTEAKQDDQGDQVGILDADPKTGVFRVARCDRLEILDSSFGEMAAAGAPIGQDLLPLLADKDAKVQGAAAAALGKMGRQGAGLAKQIVPLLASDDAGLEAGNALAELAKTSPAIADDLVELLRDGDNQVRGHAAYALSMMGQDGAAFAGKIAPLLADPKSDVRQAAALALAKLGEAGAAYTKQIAALLIDPDLNLRGQAAFALGQMGNEGAPVGAELLPLLEHQDPNVRGVAVLAFAVMGPAGAPFIKNVARLLGDADANVRCAAANSIGQMRPAAAAYSNELAALLWDKDDDARHAAAEALHWLGAAPAAPTKEIIALLVSEHVSSRRAVTALLDARGVSKDDWVSAAAVLVALASVPEAGVAELRAHLWLWAGENPALQRAVTWLGNPDLEPMPKDGLSANEACEILAVFAELWDHTAESEPLRQEMARRIREVAATILGVPTAKAMPVLEGLAVKLKDQPDYVAAYDAVRAVLYR